MVRYVGKSIDPILRYKAHCRHPSSKAMKEWIENLRAEKLVPIFELIDSMGELEAIRHYIKLGHPLLNKQLISWSEETPPQYEMPSLSIDELYEIMRSRVRNAENIAISTKISKEANRILERAAKRYGVDKTKALEIILRQWREANK